MFTKQLLSWLLVSGFVIVCSSAGGSGGTGSSGGSGGRSGGLYNYGGLAAANSGLAHPSSAAMLAGSSSRGAPSRFYMPAGLGNPEDPRGYRSTTPSQPATVTPKPNRISAWGIISIVMFVIMIGAGAYWGFICYPLFCKKERNYNMMMNMSSATTATPTRSTEFEKLENYCSKSTTSSRSNDTGISNI
ncbi:conserved hypothetical protein [Culex quinquefasciatus]|uniref:Uncharacterized protein n=1 Tax=Culex quinquefasciatus TaxID=7176 RepID=B0X0X5_CULQU|nr:conserved hypothetical protein [Culex quinquefasciatus]|eukprot:XP_001863297.1 conserved hypothetical protein [Culex quinquefasciatus]